MLQVEAKNCCSASPPPCAQCGPENLGVGSAADDTTPTNSEPSVMSDSMVFDK